MVQLAWLKVVRKHIKWADVEKHEQWLDTHCLKSLDMLESIRACGGLLMIMMMSGVVHDARVRHSHCNAHKDDNMDKIQPTHCHAECASGGHGGSHVMAVG